MVSRNKFLSLIVLFGLTFVFLGAKFPARISMSHFNLISYKPYTSELTSKGLTDLDSFAFLYCKYESLYEGGIVYITPYNLKSEFELNPYIGLDRFRSFIKILKVKHQINIENSFYFQEMEYDTYYANENRTGLHITITPRRD